MIYLPEKESQRQLRTMEIKRTWRKQKSYPGRIFIGAGYETENTMSISVRNTPVS